MTDFSKNFWKQTIFKKLGITDQGDPDPDLVVNTPYPYPTKGPGSGSTTSLSQYTYLLFSQAGSNNFIGLVDRAKKTTDPDVVGCPLFGGLDQLSSSGIWILPLLLYIGGQCHRPLCRRYPTSTSLLPKSEQICRTKSFNSDFDISFHSDIDISFHSDIDISFHSDIGLNQYWIFRYLKLIIPK